MNYLAATAAVLGLSLVAAAPVNAQSVNANNLVSVSVTNTDVANDIAEDLDVAAQDVIDIGSVQVPVGVAATVCDVDANVLAKDKGAEAATCDATNSSQALTQIVQREMNSAQQ